MRVEALFASTQALLKIQKKSNIDFGIFFFLIGIFQVKMFEGCIYYGVSAGAYSMLLKEVPTAFSAVIQHRQVSWCTWARFCLGQSRLEDVALMHSAGKLAFSPWVRLELAPPKEATTTPSQNNTKTSPPLIHIMIRA